MANPNEIPTRVVYIGGIPFDQTEEQILEIARTVGPVDKIQLIFDKETGKSKGYAFIRYNDELTAASAVRNLNKYNIGSRELKCQYAKEEAILDPFGDQQQSTDSNRNTQSRRKKHGIPPLPPGVDVYNELPGDYITRELQRMDPARLTNILKDSIKMAKSNPQLMEELLTKSPQLSYAIVQASLMVNAVNEADLERLVKQVSDSAIEPEEQLETLSEEQKKLIKQIIGLSEQEMVGLNEDQKKNVYALKSAYLGVLI